MITALPFSRGRARIAFSIWFGVRGGWIANQLQALDFAGGTAVHINAGAAGLALASGTLAFWIGGLALCLFVGPVLMALLVAIWREWLREIREHPQSP